MAEALNMVLDAEREFNQMPVEIKAKFDHDYKKYIATAGTHEWLDKLGFSKVSEQAVEKPVETFFKDSEGVEL